MGVRECAGGLGSGAAAMSAITVWFFLIAGHVNQYTTEQWTQVGPFSSEKQCEQIRDSIKERDGKKTICWEVPK